MRTVISKHFFYTAARNKVSKLNFDRKNYTSSGKNRIFYYSKKNNNNLLRKWEVIVDE